MKINAENITKAFNGNKVINSLSFKMESGGIYTLSGSSGIGKTTLIRIIAGLEDIDSGRLDVESGSNAKQSASARPTGGILFQDDRLFNDFSAIDNLKAVLPGVSEQYIEAELSRLLPGETLRRPVDSLSGGQKRRISIVRACVSSSEWLLMDEPFSGLDEGNIRKAAEYINNHAKEKLLIIAVHDEKELEGLFNITQNYSLSGAS